jgi:hypothetical protein
MGIVTGRCTESAAFMLTRENEIDNILSWECIWSAKQVEGIQTPVQTVKS